MKNSKISVKDTSFSANYLLDIRGKKLDLSSPQLMGILNITPDSFYDGGKYKRVDDVLSNVEQMLREGASIIDIGGMSSRPGAMTLSQQEELDRVLPVVELLVKQFPELILSIDAYRLEVVKEVINAGASIVNDISAGHLDSKLLDYVAENNLPYIMMHMRGKPDDMSRYTNYSNLIAEIKDYFHERVDQLKKLGHDNLLVLDPGLGFSKTLEQNYEVISKLKEIKSLNLPLLIGASRKSMIYKLLGTSPSEALNGTTAVHMIALMNGANLLRVHDVKEAKQAIAIFKQLNI